MSCVCCSCCELASLFKRQKKPYQSTLSFNSQHPSLDMNKCRTKDWKTSNMIVNTSDIDMSYVSIRKPPFALWVLSHVFFMSCTGSFIGKAKSAFVLSLSLTPSQQQVCSRRKCPPLDLYFQISSLAK